MSLRSRKSTSASSQCMRSVRSLRGPDVFNGRLATGTAAMRSRPTVAGTTAITPRTRGGPCSPDPSQDRVRRRQMAFVVVRDRDPESQCLRYWPHALSPPGRRRCGVEILRCRARASDCGAEGALCRGPSQHRGARGARRAHYRSRTGSERATHLRDLPLRGARSLVVGWLRRLQRAVLRMHLLAYATANASLVGIWALAGQGSFWPAWLLLPSSALFSWHLIASRRLTRALDRRGW